MSAAIPTEAKTEAARAYIEALRAAILPPEVAKMLASDGRQVLLALVEPDGVAKALAEAEAEAANSAQSASTQVEATIELEAGQGYGGPLVQQLHLQIELYQEHGQPADTRARIRLDNGEWQAWQRAPLAVGAPPLPGSLGAPAEPAG